MVERFYRDMKAALRSRLNGPNWVDELPWVLLGLRTAPKEDLHTSAAEIVYGTPLTVPGDFVCPSDDPVATAELLSNLRDEVLKLRPTPVLYGAPFSHLFTELKISPIEVHISAIELEISPIQLKISAIELQISPNRPI